jgi:hypothetical protein
MAISSKKHAFLASLKLVEDKDGMTQKVFHDPRHPAGCHGGQPEAGFQLTCLAGPGEITVEVHPFMGMAAKASVTPPFAGGAEEHVRLQEKMAEITQMSLIKAHQISTEGKAGKDHFIRSRATVY